MGSARPPVRSFGALARAVLGAAEWPASSNIQARSLASILSKLDRDQELEWLTDRPDVQVCLSKALGCAPADLRKPNPAERPAESRVVQLSSLRYGRTLDLNDESLPPGIPDLVRDPDRWGRVWWVAPSGAGRSLAARWLEARGLARVGDESSRADNPSRGADNSSRDNSSRDNSSRADHPSRRADHPSRRADHPSRRADGEPPLGAAARTRSRGASAIPSFIERADGSPIDPLARRVLVASPTPPANRDGWQVIAAPSLGEIAPALVRWAIERLPPDTALEEHSTLEWLREGPLARGDVHTLGGVLGWCGVLDELGLDRVRGKTSLEVAQRFLTRRLRESLGEDHADFSWMRKHALELWTGVARRTLTDDTAPFASPRNLDGWLALIPEPYRAGFDVEWMRVSLARVDSSIRPTDIERAARLLSPGAFRVLRVLRSAELLVGTDDALRPAPHWLSELVSSEAERRVLDGSPFEWGEALLRPHAANRITRHLFTRAVALDMTAPAKLAESEGEESPAHALAVETCFRVTGIATLLDVEQDPELLDAVWEEQSELWLTQDGVRVPRIEHPADPATTPLLSRGAWFAAALAHAESLDHDMATWRVPSVYSSIHESLRHADALGEEWSTRIARLFDRLRGDAPLHLLELAGFLLDRVGTNEVEWSHVAEIPNTERARFLETVRARGLTPESVASVLFDAWQRAEAPTLANTLLEPSENPLFFAVPSSLVGRVLEVAESEGLSVDASGWGGEQLGALAHALGERGLEAERAVALVASLGDSAFRQLLRHCLDADTLSERFTPIWSVAPETCSQVLAERIHANDMTAAVALSRAVPEAQADRVVGVWRASGVPRYELAELTSFLHRLVGGRASGWRDAYALLGEIERGRASA
jgi:hypothetical protein